MNKLCQILILRCSVIFLLLLFFPLSCNQTVNNIDLKIKDGKIKIIQIDNVDCIQYEISIVNIGCDVAFSGQFQVFVFIDGKKETIDLSPNNLKPNGSSFSYKGVRELNKTSKNHKVCFLIESKEKDTNLENNKLLLEITN